MKAFSSVIWAILSGKKGAKGIERQVIFYSAGEVNRGAIRRVKRKRV
jgi:hypothetical protein